MTKTVQFKFFMTFKGNEKHVLYADFYGIYIEFKNVIVKIA